MKRRQTFTLHMLLQVLATLKNTDRTSGIAGLPARVTQLGAQADELNALGEAQTRPTQASTSARNLVLRAMVDAALDVASAVALHASDAKQPDLLRTVKISPADFASSRIAHRSWLATRIADAAESVLTHLPPHVTADTLTDLRAKIRAAEAAVAQPRSTIESKVSATRRIDALLKEANETLRQIDRLVFPLRNTEPDFYADYRSARRILGRSSSGTEETAPEAVNPGTVTTAAPEASTQKLAA